MPTPVPRTLEKALDLLRVVVEDGGQRSFSKLAQDVALPASTAHRLGVVLERYGFILRERPGRYLPGPWLMAFARRFDERTVLARISRPILRELSQRWRQTVHLGVLEDSMVTYLAKAAHGPAAEFTREDMQLEAYCSGIGKVLLANVSPAARARYLSDGPFVALTSNTIVDPELLRKHLEEVEVQGWAFDDAEVFEDLKCLAVPVMGADCSVIAAISISAPAPTFEGCRREQALAALRDAAVCIERRMAGRAFVASSLLAPRSKSPLLSDDPVVGCKSCGSQP
ncbi:IclR family transcriptional regulator [Marinicauda algicola]|nr:IclR family transcriptional regulator [Marinicauda algicola]